MQIIKCFLLHGNENTSYYLFPFYCDILQFIRYNIIYILDEYHICIYIIKIFNQSTMSTRTEKKATIFITERSIIWIDSNGISRRFLLRERNIVFYTIFFRILTYRFFYLLLK